MADSEAIAVLHEEIRRRRRYADQSAKDFKDKVTRLYEALNQVERFPLNQNFVQQARSGWMFITDTLEELQQYSSEISALERAVAVLSQENKGQENG